MLIEAAKRGGLCSVAALNSVISPRRILSGESYDGIHDFLTDAWPSGLPLATGVELLRHEFAVPAENRVWRDDRRQLEQGLATNGVSFHSEQPTLVVVEQQSLPSKFFQQSLDLSVLELDDLLLPLVHEAAEAGQQDVPGCEQKRHIRRRNWPVSGAER